MSNLKTPSVPTLERTLTILELLASSRSGLTLPEIVKSSGFPKSSLHCLLVTLERRGYLHRNERTSRFLFSSKLFGLANKSLSGLELRQIAIPHLRNLMLRTGLTVHMAILEQGDAVLIEKVEPSGTVRLATWLGKRMDVHCTGLGKALIAYLPDEELSRLIEQKGLPRHNDNTISSGRKLRADLERVRAVGYSIDDEEDEIGHRCISSAIFDSAGKPAAAVSASGTVSQVFKENSVALAEQVKAAAAAISKSLTAHEPQAQAR